VQNAKSREELHPSKRLTGGELKRGIGGKPYLQGEVPFYKESAGYCAKNR
jgi:hypothetical protein